MSVGKSRGIIFLVCTAFGLSLPAAAGAVTQGPVIIDRLGVQWNSGYVDFTVPFSEPCLNGVIYFDISTEAGKGALSILLTAHASGKPIRRIDYSTDAQGMCRIDLVQL